MHKFLHKVLVVLNIVVIISALLSFASIYINPQDFWLPAFFGLAFLPIYIFLSLFTLYWLFRKKRILLYSNLIVFIFGLWYLTDNLQFNLNAKSEQDSSSFKVMSFNVRQFDLYNWKKNKENRNKYFDFIKNENPDIICFQEFYNDKTGEFKTLDTLVQFLDANKYYFLPNYKVQEKYEFGIATLTKFEIINQQSINFEGTSNLCIYTDLKIGEDTIRVYNSHLQSIHFEDTEYKFIDSLDLSINHNKITEAKGLLTKLKRAFQKRAEQADIVSNHIENCPYSIIACGDFNDSPVSYVYSKMTNKLKDSFISGGNGIGQTYNGRFPSFRIDYVLHSEEIKTLSYDAPRLDLSDHFPVICEFKISNSEQ